MARLIDADEAIKKLAYHMGTAYSYSDAVNAIANTPTVDAVEVVRCKDCEKSHFTVTCKAAKQNHDLLHWVCRINGTDVKANHYCGYGVRRKTDG